MNESYKVNTIIIMYNIFDTIGRKFPEVFFISRNSFYSVAFLRIIFLFSLPLNLMFKNKEWLSVIFHYNFRKIIQAFLQLST